MRTSSPAVCRWDSPAARTPSFAKRGSEDAATDVSSMEQLHEDGIDGAAAEGTSEFVEQWGSSADAAQNQSEEVFRLVTMRSEGEVGGARSKSKNHSSI